MNKVLKRLKFPAMLTTSAFLGMYISNGMFAGMGNACNEVKNDFQNLTLCRESKYIEYFNEEYGKTFSSLLLRHRSIISLDLAQIHNLENLKFFNELDKIEICNAQLLNDYWIELINECDVDEIYLKFDSKGIVNNINNKFDFNRFSDKSKIKSVVLQDCKDEYTDFEGVLLLNYFKNYDDIECLNLDEYKEFDEKLDQILDKLSIDESKGNIYKLIVLSRYVDSHIKYDPFVKKVNSYMNNLSTLDDNELEFYMSNKDKKNERALYYNDYPLESILDDINSESYGVCISYAKLYSALAIKLGIPLHNTYSINHAWNLYAEQGVCDVPCYIDLTALDNNQEFADAVDQYISNENELDFYNVTNQMFMPTNSVLSISNYVSCVDVKDYYRVMPDNEDRIFGSTEKMSYQDFMIDTLLIELLLELIEEFIKCMKKKKKLTTSLKNMFFEDVELTEEEIQKIYCRSKGR